MPRPWHAISWDSMNKRQRYYESILESGFDAQESQGRNIRVTAPVYYIGSMEALLCSVDHLA
jgi:hypothetical protein